MSEKLLSADDLKGIMDNIHMAKVQEQFARARKEEEEKRAAEQGLRETQVLTFPASYCNDQGRRINNAEPDWPDSLEGFAKKAHAFFEAELKPLGFHARAQILNYPDGRLGDVGLFL